MKNVNAMLLVLAVVLVGVYGYNTTEAQPTVDPPLKIAVVSVNTVLTQCQASIDKQTEDEARVKKIEDELKVLANEVEAIKQELQNALEPGSKQFMERRKEWFTKQAQLQALNEYQKEALTVEQQAWSETLYESFLQEVARVAKAKNITLVLNKDESPVKSRNLNDLLSMIVSRKVLYNSPSLDITAAVQESMDRLYEREKASK